jgi:hypothetical protein
LAYVAVAVAAGCASGERARPHRWPNHRPQSDAHFAALEERNAVLQAEITDLARRIVKLEAAAAHASASAQPASSAPP